MTENSNLKALVLAAVVLLVACSQAVETPDEHATSPSPMETEAHFFTLTPDDPSTPTPNTSVTAPPAQSRQESAAATDEPEYRWAQLLRPDDIRPVYEPVFVAAEEAGYADDELVMGIEFDGDAKAYPVGMLNRREMVNDELAGIPILVTW